MVQSLIATIRFELARSITPQRMLVAAVLALFPPVLMFFILSTGAQLAGPLPIVVLIWLILLLSLLLWATPVISSELEYRSWLFITSRRHGRIALLLGKFLTAVLVSGAVATLAAVLSIGVLHLLEVPLVEELRDLSLLALIWLATVTYAAVFIFIGVAAPRRSMAVAAGYVILAEVLLATAPALVNKLTVRFYLQGLAMEWLDPLIHPQFDRAEYYLLYGQFGTGTLVVVLLAMTFCLVSASLLLVRRREYLTTAEF